MGSTVIRDREVDRLARVTGAGLQLERRRDGLLWATGGDGERPVSVRACFPWSATGAFVSLRDEADEEYALVTDPADLDEMSRRALEATLVEAGFVLQVTRVLAIEEEVEVRHWRVHTRQGPRAFQTRLDEWPWPVGRGGLLIRDVGGDLYHVADPAGLDAGSRALLWAFMD